MEISSDRAVAEVEYKGKTYYFCGKGEKETFLRDPEKYLKGETGPENDPAQ
ncbi:MAG: YHS domain-containing protein [Deltaproteobacteria bacterium]|nr:YHS domain-containing protein [Deltaproteobacteria bacterium]